MIKIYHFLFDNLGFISMRGSEKYGTKFSPSSYYSKIYILSFCMLCFLMTLLCWNGIKTSSNNVSIKFTIFAVAIIAPFIQHIYLSYKGFAEEVFAKYNYMPEDFKKKSLYRWICTGMLPYCFFPILVIGVLYIINYFFY